jgi:hypothetical protein
MELLLYLDQNYLSGIVKRKVAFRELEPVLRAAVARDVVAVPESEAHRLESAARPDLPLPGQNLGSELLIRFLAWQGKHPTRIRGPQAITTAPRQRMTTAFSSSLRR